MDKNPETAAKGRNACQVTTQTPQDTSMEMDGEGLVVMPSCLFFSVCSWISAKQSSKKLLGWIDAGVERSYVVQEAGSMERDITRRNERIQW